MRIMGIDYGKKRIGIAISDEDRLLAFPSIVLDNDSELIPQIKELAKINKVRDVVLGESTDFSGKDNPIMKEISEFAEKLQKETRARIHMEPEFLTSAQAERTQGKNKMQDASAAAIILQSFLDKQRKKLQQ